MKGVDFTKVESQPFAEHFAGLAAEVVFTTQVIEDARAFGGNVFVSAEQAFAFAHGHGTQLTSPRIDVPEDVPMNPLEVIQIELAGQRPLAKLV